MPEPKQYVPKANVRSRQTDWGEFLSVGFNVEELIKFAQANKNDRGYLNLTIAPRKNPDENATHSIYLDTYKPGQRQGASSPPTAHRQPAPPATSAPDAPVDDVPF